MNGPVKKHSIGIGLGWLEIASAIAGLVVVLGLAIESGPELWQAFRTWTWPTRAAIGGTVITLGVFAEVAIGIFLARSAKAAKLEANAAIAEANERAAKADLARVRLERWFARRDISDEERDAIAAKLSGSQANELSPALFPRSMNRLSSLA